MKDAEPDTSADRKRSSVRATVVVVAAVLTVSLSGFFMGLRQTVRETQGTDRGPETQTTTAAADESHNPDGIPVAVSYMDIRKGSLKPNREWSNSISELRKIDLSTLEETPETTRQRQILRVSRRAFDGAPPVVPHPIDQHTSASCLACHNSNKQIRGVIAPQISHDYITSCTQCHVAGDGIREISWNTSDYAISETTSFSGKAAPKAGTRAYDGAPPTIPHSQWMRNNCMSCHGPGGSSALRTSHPDRQSCTQCHAPSADLDQRHFLEASFPFRPEYSKKRTQAPTSTSATATLLQVVQ